MRPFILAATLFLPLTLLHAQAPPPLDPAHAAEMKKLDWLVGEWEGEAVFQMGPDQKATVQQSERIEKRVGGTVLLIEGLGRMDGKVVHDAFAIVTWDPVAKKHVVSAYLANGRSVVADAKATDRTLEWWFDTPEGSMRYVIERAEDGRWIETGYRNRPGGEPAKFLEMNLKKLR